MPSASCQCSTATSPAAVSRPTRWPPMAAMPAATISMGPKPAASPMSPSTKSVVLPLRTWPRARGCTASCATSAPVSRPAFPASSAPMAGDVARGVGSTASKPTSGRRWWPTTWCCSPASNRDSAPRALAAWQWRSPQSSSSVCARSPSQPSGIATLPRNLLLPHPRPVRLRAFIVFKNMRLWTGTSLEALAIAISTKVRHTETGILVRVSTMDVADWLRKLGLVQYEPAFRANKIDAGVLPSLTAEDLKDIGVTLVGDRRRLLDAISGLRTEALVATEATAPRDALQRGDAERRQLTVMFCDLVGSTALSTRLDPEDLREVIGAYHRAVTEVVTEFDGFISRYMGDGVLVYFGYPQAHEEDAERAVRAGLSAIAAI